MRAPERWTSRRALLVDVPAVARLIDPPPAADRPGLPDDAVLAAARLLLTHVALEAGEFWVAADDEGTVRAAAVLLPPRAGPDGLASREADAAHGVLRLHLGLTLPFRPDAPDLQASPADGPNPGRHWILVCVITDGAETAIPGLLRRVLRVADESGLPVICPRPGSLADALHDRGFRTPSPGTDAEFMIRPVTVPALSPATP